MILEFDEPPKDTIEYYPLCNAKFSVTDCEYMTDYICHNCGYGLCFYWSDHNMWHKLSCVYFTIGYAQCYIYKDVTLIAIDKLNHHSEKRIANKFNGSINLIELSKYISDVKKLLLLLE